MMHSDTTDAAETDRTTPGAAAAAAEGTRDLVAVLGLLSDSVRRDTVWCFACRMQGTRRPGTVLLELRVGDMRWFSRVSCRACAPRQRADMLRTQERAAAGPSVTEQPFAPGELVARVFTRLGLEELPREAPVGLFEVTVDPPGGSLRVRGSRAGR